MNPHDAYTHIETLDHVGEVYSNLYCALDEDVARQLEEGGKVGQHSAWNFCGYVWFDTETETWYELRMCYGAPVEVHTGDTIRDVIEDARDAGGAA